VIEARSAGAPEIRIAGLFVPFHRNRPFGEERVVSAGTARGGLRIEAATTFDLPRLSLRQEVIADYDAALRPVSCTMSAHVNGRTLRIEVQVDRNRALTSVVFEGHRREETIALDRAPLLLVDNCFAVHALAGLTALDRTAPGGTFRSIPASEVVTVAVPGASSLLLGGRDFGAPDVTMILARDLEEHFWLDGGWVSRLLIPQAHMGAEWVRRSAVEGGRS
jgi:hypothetical protein